MAGREVRVDQGSARLVEGDMELGEQAAGLVARCPENGCRLKQLAVDVGAVVGDIGHAAARHHLHAQLFQTGGFGSQFLRRLGGARGPPR